MATVVNTTPAGIEREGYGISWVVGLLLLLMVVFMLFSYGLPALRSATTNSTPSVSVPERVDVNVNQNPGGAPTTP